MKTECAYIRGPVSASNASRLEALAKDNHLHHGLHAGLTFAVVIKRGLDSIDRYPIRKYESLKAI